MRLAKFKDTRLETVFCIINCSSLPSCLSIASNSGCDAFAAEGELTGSEDEAVPDRKVILLIQEATAPKRMPLAAEHTADLETDSAFI